MKRLCASASARTGLRGAAVMALAAGMLAGCASSSGETGSGAIDTGTFPNLNIRPQVAATQLTAEEQAQKTAELRASQGAAVANSNTQVPNDQAELQRLARTHADETLAEIEMKKKKKPK